MDRRTLLRSFSGRSARASLLPPSTSFSKYSGPWTYEMAAHLLRRTTFGPRKSDVEWSVNRGLQGTIDKLFTNISMPAPPVNVKYGNDPNVPIGQTWINAPYVNVTPETGYRRHTLFAWTLRLMLKEGISIREKLTMFWHNHFPISEILDPKFMYRYITLFRQRAWGNFREITKRVTIDPAMLRYLNGNTNRVGAPNENYARELLELFTIGKGPQVAPGDYTNYTEQDVKEVARMLTGWRDFGFTVHSTDGSIGASFNSNYHDTGTKTLSHRFNNRSIGNRGNQEYAYLIDVIFEQPEVSRFICRKLYRWFVYYDITPEVETNIIGPMAQILRNNNYEIKPALQALLSSTHFYDQHFIGAMVKHPYDFILSTFKSLDVAISPEPDKNDDSLYRIYMDYANLMQMRYYYIPQVAGWRAYYLAPTYYRDWINSSTLPTRFEVIELLCGGGIFPFKSNGITMKIDVLRVVDGFANPFDPNDLIEELARTILPRPLLDGQHNAMKNVLIPGLPDFEWTVEYTNYVDNPGNSTIRNAVQRKLKDLFRAMMSLAEFQLI